MKYIEFIPSKHDIGGLGHCFCDYLTSFIISEIYEDVIFIHNDLVVSNQTRNMLVKNNNNTFWNNYLNLNNLSLHKKTDLEYNKINITKRYQSININNLKKYIINNKINYLTNCNRIYLFDLYHYESLNIVPKNTTINIINKIKNNFYIKHKKMIKNKKFFNIYTRKGDFENHKILKKTINNNFISNAFKLIYKHLKDNNQLEKYEINIISAGTEKQMKEIIKNYKDFKVNFLLNKNEEEVFYLMTQSDILLFYASSFPFTASLFSDGLIIKKLKDNYFYNAVVHKNIKFLDNYIIKDEINNEDLKKIKIYI
jgi:hypothetical protein